MKEKISIIIPFLNEAENIPFLVGELNRFFSSSPECAYEVVFVCNKLRELNKFNKVVLQKFFLIH